MTVGGAHGAKWQDQKKAMKLRPQLSSHKGKFPALRSSFVQGLAVYATSAIVQ